MRVTGLLFSLALLATPAWAHQDVRSPLPADDVPTFVNAEVTSVDASGTVAFRSESGDTVLRASDVALRAASGLRPGDKVILTYRTRVGTDGKSFRVITDVGPASPSSGEPGRRTVTATTTVISPNSGGVRTVRVISTDRPRRTITFVDPTGVFVVPVSRTVVRQLTTISPGATVALTLDPRIGTGLGTITTIRTVPTAPLFGPDVVFPPVSGQLVRVNSAANMVTVRTTGGELTVPVSAAALGSLATLRAGDDVSFDLSLAGTASPATVTAIRTLPGGTLTTLPATGAVTTTTPSAGTAVTGTAPPVAGGAVVVSGGPAAVPGGVTPSAVGGVVSNVPSVPAPTPAVTAVLPPAVAKAPLSDAEVGAQRGQGERDLDAAAVALAGAANDIDAAWVRFKNACLVGVTIEATPGREWFLFFDDRVRRPADDNCRAMDNEVRGRALGFRDQVTIATEAARKADVLPGRIREILERHRLNF